MAIGVHTTGRKLGDEGVEVNEGSAVLGFQGRVADHASRKTVERLFELDTPA